VQIKEVKKQYANVLLVSSKRERGCYNISNNKPYQKLLEEIQVRLIALDVAENKKQSLALILDTKHKEQITKHIELMCKVLRCDII